MEANQAVVEAVEQLAAAKGATAAQVALACLLARGPSIVPIFGTRRLDRVKENLGAAEVSLSDEDMAAIEARLARIKITGERLPPALLAARQLRLRVSPRWEVLSQELNEGLERRRHLASTGVV